MKIMKMKLEKQSNTPAMSHLWGEALKRLLSRARRRRDWRARGRSTGRADGQTGSLLLCCLIDSARPLAAQEVDAVAMRARLDQAEAIAIVK